METKISEKKNVSFRVASASWGQNWPKTISIDFQYTFFFTCQFHTDGTKSRKFVQFMKSFYISSHWQNQKGVAGLSFAPSICFVNIFDFFEIQITLPVCHIWGEIFFKSHSHSNAIRSAQNEKKTEEVKKWREKKN